MSNLLRIFVMIVVISSISLFGCSKRIAKNDGAVYKEKNGGKNKLVLRGSENTNSSQANNSGLSETDTTDQVKRIAEGLQTERVASNSFESNSGKTDEELKKEAQDIRDKLMELEKVYFAYDKSDIMEKSRKTLNDNAEVLGEQRNVDILIEGHSDERGTDDYNLALGQRRAESVKDYLINLGVSEMRITTISYGETSPDAIGHDESAWKWNRRAVLKERTE